MHSTGQGVVKAKSKLMSARVEGVDVSAWQKLINNVELMSRNIFVEMKARERSAIGCYFYEHEWIPRSLLSVKLELFTPRSCCTFFVTKMSLECRHCRFIVHKSQSCKLIALQTPCKSLIQGQDAPKNGNGSRPPIRNMIEMNKLVFEESLMFTNNQDLLTASYLSSVVYDDKIDADDDLFVHVNEGANTKFLINVTGTTAFVIARGTVVSSVSNWITNTSALLRKVSDEFECKAHTGFLSACEAFYPIVWDKLQELSVTRVVFGGHSLGGAIAHALHLKSLLDTPRGISMMSVGFGSPLVFDLHVPQVIRSRAGKLENFVTIVNEFDPVPSIIQTIGSGLLRNILAAVIAPGVTTTIVGLVSKEVTKNYVAFGRYIFFDSGGEWESTSSVKSMERLKKNNDQAHIDSHEMNLYHSRLAVYLERLESEYTEKQMQLQFRD
jgi:hypothetical protein